MSDTDKTLCGWNKETRMRDFEHFKAIVLDPQYACKNCGRVAVKETRLCKPIPLFDKS